MILHKGSSHRDERAAGAWPVEMTASSDRIVQEKQMAGGHLIRVDIITRSIITSVGSLSPTCRRELCFTGSCVREHDAKTQARGSRSCRDIPSETSRSARQRGWRACAWHLNFRSKGLYLEGSNATVPEPPAVATREVEVNHRCHLRFVLGSQRAGVELLWDE